MGERNKPDCFLIIFELPKVFSPKKRKTVRIDLLKLGNDPDVVIEYEIDITQNFKFVENENQISEFQDILVLVDSHEPTPDQTVGGKADYNQGVATVDIDGVESGSQYISTLKKKLTKGNGGNHEVWHLLGGGDRYQYKKFVLVKDNPKSLMGTGNSLNVVKEDVEDVVTSVLNEFARIKKNSKTAPYQPTNYKGGGFYKLNHQNSSKTRIQNAQSKHKTTSRF